MASINKVILVGHVGRDPEGKYLPSGEHVVNFSLATSETWKDKSGAKQEATEWHRVSFFGKTAEVISEYVKKGTMLYIEGRIQTRKWTDKDGVEKYSTEIRGDRMQMLGGKSQESGGTEQRAKPTGSKFDQLEDDIPFS